MDIRYVRVLQKSISDEIRVGKTFMTDNIEQTVKQIKEAYVEKLKWWLKSHDDETIEDAFADFYLEIAVVDASTLSTIEVVWKPKNCMDKYI